MLFRSEIENAVKKTLASGLRTSDITIIDEGKNTKIIQNRFLRSLTTPLVLSFIVNLSINCATHLFNKAAVSALFDLCGEIVLN